MTQCNILIPKERNRRIARKEWIELRVEPSRAKMKSYSYISGTFGTHIGMIQTQKGEANTSSMALLVTIEPYSCTNCSMPAVFISKCSMFLPSQISFQL
jgi:hypothetical protein